MYRRKKPVSEGLWVVSGIYLAGVVRTGGRGGFDGPEKKKYSEPITAIARIRPAIVIRTAIFTVRFSSLKTTRANPAKIKRKANPAKISKPVLTGVTSSNIVIRRSPP